MACMDNTLIIKTLI